MIGRDPLARNRDARLAWTSSIAAGEDEEWCRARIGGKAGARRKSMRSSGLLETLRGSVATVFCNAYCALRTLFLMEDLCVSSRPVEPS
jgi:hypothetical protein